MWISAEFKLLLITEYQRLKNEEAARLNSGWDYRRFLSKTNQVIHTDAINECLIPELSAEQAKQVYANEADMFNVANQKLCSQGLNIRDTADIHQLIVLSNLESGNAYLIGKGISQRDRLPELRKMAMSQLLSLRRRSAYTIEKIQGLFEV